MALRGASSLLFSLDFRGPCACHFVTFTGALAGKLRPEMAGKRRGEVSNWFEDWIVIVLSFCSNTSLLQRKLVERSTPRVLLFILHYIYRDMYYFFIH